MVILSASLPSWGAYESSTTNGVTEFTFTGLKTDYPTLAGTVESVPLGDSGFSISNASKWEFNFQGFFLTQIVGETFDLTAPDGFEIIEVKPMYNTNNYTSYFTYSEMPAKTVTVGLKTSGYGMNKLVVSVQKAAVVVKDVYTSTNGIGSDLCYTLKGISNYQPATGIYELDPLVVEIGADWNRSNQMVITQTKDATIKFRVPGGKITSLKYSTGSSAPSLTADLTGVGTEEVTYTNPTEYSGYNYCQIQKVEIEYEYAQTSKPIELSWDFTGTGFAPDMSDKAVEVYNQATGEYETLAWFSPIEWGKTYPLPTVVAKDGDTVIEDGVLTWSLGKGGKKCNLEFITKEGVVVTDLETQTPSYFRIKYPVYNSSDKGKGYTNGPDVLCVAWEREGYKEASLTQEFRMFVPSEKKNVEVEWVDAPAQWPVLKYGEKFELPELRAMLDDGTLVRTIDVTEYGYFSVYDQNGNCSLSEDKKELIANKGANGEVDLQIKWYPNSSDLSVSDLLSLEYSNATINYYNVLNSSATISKKIEVERVYHNIVPVVDFGEGKTSIEVANFDKNIDLSEKFPYHAEGKDAVTGESLYNVSGTWEFSSADETLFTVEKGEKEVENPHGSGTTKVETWTLTPCEDKQGDTKLIAKFTPNATQDLYEVKEYEFEIPVTVTPKQNAFAPEVKMTVDGGEYTVYVEGEDGLGDTSMIPVDANYFVNKGSFDVTVRENSNGTKTLYTLDGSDPLEEGNSNVKELVASEGNGKIEFTGDDAVEVEDKYMGVPVRKVILTIANVSDEYEPSEVQTFEADYFAIQTLYNFEMVESDGFGYMMPYVPTSADKAVNFEYIEAAGLYTGFLPYIEDSGYLAEWGYSQYNLIPPSLSIKYALLPEGEDLDQTQGSDGTKKLLEIYDPEEEEDENGYMMRYVDFSNKADGDLVLYVWAASESANGPALAQKVTITKPEAPEAPTFSVAEGGVVLHTGKLAIEVPEGVSVRYTLDGTEPTATEGAVYNDPITFGESYLDKLGNYTVKAIAYLTNYPASASEVVSTTFELKEDLSTTDIVGNLMFGQQMFSSEDPKVYSDRITMTEDPQIENGKIEAQMELNKRMNTLKGYEDEHEDVFVGAITLNGTEGAVGTATLKFEDKKVSKLKVTANSTSTTHNTVLVVNGKEIDVRAELGTSYEDSEGQIKYNLTYDMLKEKNTYDVEVEEYPINEIVLSAKAGSPAVEVYAIAFEYTGYRADRPAVSVNEDNKVVIEMDEHSVEARYYFSSSELSDDTLKGLKYEDMTKYEAPFGFETGGYIYAVAYNEDNLPSNFTKFEYVANVAATLSVDEAYVAAGTAAKVKLSTGASLMNYKLILKDAEGEDADVTVSVADDGYANNRKVTFKNPGVYTVEATWEKGYGYSAGNAVLDGEITVYAPLDITKIAEKVNYKGTSINLVEVKEEDFDLAKAINAGDATATIKYRDVVTEGNAPEYTVATGTAFTPKSDFQQIEVVVVANEVESPAYKFYYATEAGIEENFRTELVLTCQVDESVKYEAKVDQVHIPVIGLADADEDNLPAFEYEILDSEGKTVAEDLYTLDKDKAPYDLYITFKEAGIYNLHISWEKNAQYQHGETTSAGITIYEAPHITDNDKGIKLNGSGLKFHSSGKGLVFAEGARDHKVTVEVPDEKTELWYRAIELKSGSEAAKAIRRAADAAADPDSDDTDLEGFQKLEGSELTLAGEHGTLEMFTKKNGVSSMIERVAYTNDATKILDILDGDINTGIEGVDADLEGAEYYDLNGYRVDGRELKAGIYVRVLNGESTKVIIR